MDIRPMSEFRDHGLLWLINRTVFHPRGFSLALAVEADGDISGWVIQGTGAEPWVFGPEDEEDAAFAAVEQLLQEARDGR